MPNLTIPVSSSSPGAAPTTPAEQRFNAKRPRSFARGLLYAVPLSLALWGLLLWRVLQGL